MEKAKQKEKTAAGRHTTKDRLFTDLFDHKEYQKQLHAVLHPEDPKIKSSELETLALETILDRGIQKGQLRAENLTWGEAQKMRHSKIKQAVVLVAAILLLSGSAFAAEEVILSTQGDGFPGFEQNNLSILNDIAFWQTDTINKKMNQKTAGLKIIRVESGKHYLEIEGLGRAEVRPLKVIADGVCAKNTVSIETGNTVELTNGSRWTFVTSVSGKKIQKGDMLGVFYDNIDQTHRLLPFEDNWQVPVK